jgi:hypothetical protein
LSFLVLLKLVHLLALNWVNFHNVLLYYKKKIGSTDPILVHVVAV